jgi:hypothetical protein
MHSQAHMLHTQCETMRMKKWFVQNIDFSRLEWDLLNTKKTKKCSHRAEFLMILLILGNFHQWGLIKRGDKFQAFCCYQISTILAWLQYISTQLGCHFFLLNNSKDCFENCEKFCCFNLLLIGSAHWFDLASQSRDQGSFLRTFVNKLSNCRMFVFLLCFDWFTLFSPSFYESWHQCS